MANWVRARHRGSHSRGTRRRGLAFSLEAMEDRCLLAVGEILFNQSSGVVTIEGANSYADVAQVTVATQNTSSISDDIVRVELRNTGSPLVREFALAPFSWTAGTHVIGFYVGVLPLDHPGVNGITFNGYGGNDTVDNLTSIRLRAYGGSGSDILLGGWNDDVFLGGPGNDYIDGRLGGDMIWGETGSDALFGDDGIDLILGGDDNDYLFGGNGDDSLYGEGGNDWLFGGAGLDGLQGNAGQNTLKADFGASNVHVNGYETWDWFDRNLQNYAVRSLARVRYIDRAFQRTDLLEIYASISQNDYVSTYEFNDLKDLTNTYLTMWDSYRNLSKKVANGDRANQWYQGGTLGNLVAGDTGQRLNRLVDKWFRGGDLPSVAGVDDPLYWSYVQGSLYRSGITYTDVDQGRDAKDCYFLAALADLAQQEPSEILNMIYDNGDGTYTVRFFHGSTAEYVTVNRLFPTDYYGNAHFAGWGDNPASSSNNELWVALLEKAYMQINESGWINQDGTNSYTGIQFGHPSDAFRHMLGRSASNSSLSNSMTAAVNAYHAGKAITFSSKDSGVDSYINDNHVYSLVSYNPSTQRFTLFEPHNTDGNYPDHVELTWSQIRHNFSQWTSIAV